MAHELSQALRAQEGHSLVGPGPYMMVTLGAGATALVAWLVASWSVLSGQGHGPAARRPGAR